MKRWLAALVVTILWVGTFAAAAREAPLLSPAQLHKILKFLDTIGAKEEFPAPTAQNLGLSDNPNQVLPITSVVTADHRVYFCRSRLNPNDYIIWVRDADQTSSYMFATRADLKLRRALYLRINDFPQTQDSNSPQVQAMYDEALTALAKDVDQNAPH